MKTAEYNSTVGVIPKESWAGLVPIKLFFWQRQKSQTCFSMTWLLYLDVKLDAKRLIRTYFLQIFSLFLITLRMCWPLWQYIFWYCQALALITMIAIYFKCGWALGHSKYIVHFESRFFSERKERARQKTHTMKKHTNIFIQEMH